MLFHYATTNYENSTSLKHAMGLILLVDFLNDFIRLLDEPHFYLI